MAFEGPFLLRKNTWGVFQSIDEFSKENTQPKENTQKVYESQTQAESHDKKFKLAHIKGLKIAKVSHTFSIVQPQIS